MLNFNGQLKNRTVNLGGGRRNTRAHLLHHAQIQRQKRGAEKENEKQILLVQASVRKYLDLLRFRTEISTDWPPHDPHDLNATVFHFNIFFASTYQLNLEKSHERLIYLLKLLRNPDNMQHLSDVNKVGLYKTINRVLATSYFHKDISSSLIEPLLDLSILIYTAKLFDTIKPTIIPQLSHIIEILAREREFEKLELPLRVITLYASSDSLSYVHFLASQRSLLNSTTIDIDFDSIYSSLKNHNSLTTNENLKIFFLLIEQSKQSLTKEALESIVITLDNTKGSILLTRTEFSELDEDDRPKNVLLISDEENTTLRKLYTRKFVVNAYDLLHDPHTLAILFTSMIRIKPAWKSNFIIYLISKGLNQSITTVTSSKLFINISELSEESLMQVTGSSNIYKLLFKENHDLVFYDIFMLIEILKYHLIISNDYELFNTSLQKDTFYKLGIFLKKLTLILLWNDYNDSTDSMLNEESSQLRDLSVKVLNQIYLKDSRLKIFPKDYWLIKSSALNNATTMKDTIGKYEEKKGEFPEDFDSQYVSTLIPDIKARLNIYLNAPFFIPFEVRVEIFQYLVSVDSYRSDSFSNQWDFFLPRQKSGAIIRREHVFEDAYDSFNNIGKKFKSKLQITFKNDYGEEAGIDGGGITKEFLTSVVEEGFQDIFVENSDHELYPNPEIGLKYKYRIDSEYQLKRLSYTNFMGKIIGKCLYERVLVDIPFAVFFLTKFNKGYRNSFSDLRSLDEELYSNLIKLLTFSDDVLNELNLTFTVDEVIDGKSMSIDLIPNGSMMRVDSANRLKFIHEMSNYKLNKLIDLQTNSFLNGLFEIISDDWLSMFNPYELQLLISGEKDISIDDLKENTVYGGYTAEDETIKDFWEVVEEMSREERANLIKFATSVPKAPLLGFKALSPRFGINNSGTDHRLPTSSTCVNLLKLPNYKNKEELRKKLLYSINAEARFDLS